jgi:hypothetical protein
MDLVSWSGALYQRKRRERKPTTPASPEPFEKAELEDGGRNADDLVSLGGKPRNEEKTELEGGNHNA